MRRIIFFIITLFLFSLVSAAQQKADYYVCAYVWPSCHDDPLARKWIWPEGEGEWEVIRKGNPRFDGHYQPRIPLLGYGHDDDPEVVEKWIQLALDHGINTFVYDWYWFRDPDGYSGPFLEDALDKGFLGAPSNRKMNFYLMYANHDVKYSYWNYHKWGTDADKLLFNPRIGMEDWKKVVDRVITQYFHLPNYVKIDGCPVFAIFNTGIFEQGFSSPEEAAAAMDYFREEVKKAGFPGLHVQLTPGGGSDPSSRPGGGWAGGIDRYKINSIAFYNMGGFNPDYEIQNQNAVRIRNRVDSLYRIPLFPTVSIGWDDTPRFPRKGEKDVTHINYNPQTFEKYLRIAKDYADAHRDVQPPFVMINAWNEWVEGSYLLPDQKWGYSYLDAVKRVFAEADFRIMSFNMERGDLGVSKGRGWDVRAPGALAMLEHQSPDLLGVQECNSLQRDDILSRMPSYKCIGVAVSGAADDYPATSANHIFYKSDVVELLDSGQFWFAFEPDSVGMYTWIAKKPRSATWARFRHIATGREFIHINNHLQNGVDAVLNRAMSFMELLRMMREINPDGLPMLYTGDLNSKGIESYYAPLRQEMQEAVNACPVTDKGITHGGYKRKSGEGGQIDHIFFSGALEGLRFAVDRDTYEGIEHISDHFPVYADFKFTDNTPSYKEFWYDLKPAEGDFSITAGTWNLFSTVEREQRKAPAWKDVKVDAARIIGELDADIVGLQELTEPMVRDLPKLLKASCGKKFKLWTAFSDPSADNPAREAVGLLYNAERFSVSNQRQCWITAGDMDAPSKPWGDEYRSLLSAVFKDKATGKRFFVMTGRLCRGETPIKNEGNVIKKIEKALNPEGLPCLLLVDMNCAPKNQVWLSLLNYWSDTYTLMYPFTDRKFSTRAAPQEYESNTPKDWSSKMDLVCISRYVENRIIVTDHKVHREAVRSCDKFPSDHYPVTATLVFK